MKVWMFLNFPLMVKIAISLLPCLLTAKLIEPQLLIQTVGFYCQFAEDAVKPKQDLV